MIQFLWVIFFAVLKSIMLTLWETAKAVAPKILSTVWIWVQTNHVACAYANLSALAWWLLLSRHFRSETREQNRKMKAAQALSRQYQEEMAWNEYHLKTMTEDSGFRLREHYERNVELEEEFAALTGKMKDVSLLHRVEDENIKLEEENNLLEGQFDVLGGTNRRLSRDLENNRHRVALLEAKLLRAERSIRELHALNMREEKGGRSVGVAEGQAEGVRGHPGTRGQHGGNYGGGRRDIGSKFGRCWSNGDQKGTVHWHRGHKAAAKTPVQPAETPVMSAEALMPLAVAPAPRLWI